MDARHCIWDTVCVWFDGNCYNVSEFRRPNPKYVKACLVVGVSKVRLWRKRRVWSLWVCQDLWQPSQTTRQSLRILSETVGWTLRLTEITARDKWGGIFPPEISKPVLKVLYQIERHGYIFFAVQDLDSLPKCPKCSDLIWACHHFTFFRRLLWFKPLLTVSFHLADKY